MKETEISFEATYAFETMAITFYSQGEHLNRLDNVLVDGTYPLDVPEILTNRYYEDLKMFLTGAMIDQAKKYWKENQIAA